ncbi:hypothetical protein [Streptomyces sp. NPDC057552]|uniref:hypothetical protein n=1 Tax=Streptomyces sp. NPDC057552 TaxID=3350537 RepID=UPI003693B061
MGPFAPLRVRGGGAYRLRRILRRQRRALAAALALAGAALATTGLGATGPGTTALGAAGPGSAEGGAAASDTAEPGRPSARLVSAPVRIADAATVRLLRPGDRVDVIAVGGPGEDARLVARGVRVARVPVQGPVSGDGGHLSGGAAAIGAGGAPEGALVMLSVERATATALLGAGASGRLAVAVSDAN